MTGVGARLRVNVKELQKLRIQGKELEKLRIQGEAITLASRPNVVLSKDNPQKSQSTTIDATSTKNKKIK